MYSIFDEIDAMETLVKANVLLWNADPAERAKYDYAGFRTILKTLSDLENLSGDDAFPILCFDPDEELVMDTSNNSYAPNGALVPISAYTLQEEGVTAYTKKKQSHDLLVETLKTLEKEVSDGMAIMGTYIESYKVYLSLVVTIC